MGIKRVSDEEIAMMRMFDKLHELECQRLIENGTIDSADDYDRNRDYRTEEIVNENFNDHHNSNIVVDDEGNRYYQPPF